MKRKKHIAYTKVETRINDNRSKHAKKIRIKASVDKV